MPPVVLQSGVVRGNQGSAKALPIAPAAGSKLLLVVLYRSASIAPAAAHTPAGWTLVTALSNAADAFGLFTATAGSVANIPSCTQIPGSSATSTYVLVELDASADLARMTYGQVATPGASSFGTVPCPATAPHPSAINGAVLALTVPFGTSGDPAAGCYIDTLAGWTKRHCDTFGGNFHPWWALNERAYAAAPATIGATFTYPAGLGTSRSNIGLTVIVPPRLAPAIPPRFW